MKIFYAVQATGNGHISRALALLPRLQQYGNVDVFLSGNNSHLSFDDRVKYRSKGISLFYNNKGGLNYWKIMSELRPVSLWEEIRDLPVEKYDLVLNDFDFITSIACMRKKIPSIHFGHQASFLSELVPRPVKKNIQGEWLLKNYVKASHHVGLHFLSYDTNILPAIIKHDVLEATPKNKGHITVYLSSYSEQQLVKSFSPLKDVLFHIFSREASCIRRESNIIFFPVDRALFLRSLVCADGIITGGGFETPAEALHLGKKMLIIPIKGQYEQQCNAAALEHLYVTTAKSIDEDFKNVFSKWMEKSAVATINYHDSVNRSLEHIFSLKDALVPRWPAQYPLFT